LCYFLNKDPEEKIKDQPGLQTNGSSPYVCFETLQFAPLAQSASASGCPPKVAPRASLPTKRTSNLPPLPGLSHPVYCDLATWTSLGLLIASRPYLKKEGTMRMPLD
jgi:hypothetical protein